MSTQTKDEAAMAKAGEEIAEALQLKRDPAHTDRWQTTWGSKTATGLYLSLQRMMETVQAGKFTVLLLRPDYIADNFGQDTYQALVNVPLMGTKADAIKEAQQVAQLSDMQQGDPDNYHVLAVYKGHINDIKDQS